MTERKFLAAFWFQKDENENLTANCNLSCLSLINLAPPRDCDFHVPTYERLETVILLSDWVSRGAWRATKKPLVKWEALAIAPMKLFHTALEDLMKCTKAEHNELPRTTRTKAVTGAINTLMARLSGGCSRHEGRGCKLVRAEMNSCKSQAAMEWNHRDPTAKENGMSTLRDCPVSWHKEGIRGDCESECKGCHKKIDAFQNGGPCPPGYSGE